MMKLIFNTAGITLVLLFVIVTLLLGKVLVVELSKPFLPDCGSNIKLDSLSSPKSDAYVCLKENK